MGTRNNSIMYVYNVLLGLQHIELQHMCNTFANNDTKEVGGSKVVVDYGNSDRR